MDVACEQEHAAGRAQDDDDADDRFLHVGIEALRPCQKQSAAKCGHEGCHLHRDSFRFEAELIRE